MAKPLDHPLPQRISHWVNLINFIVLGVTGYFIHAPYQGLPINLIRNLHFIFMYLLVINGGVRFYYAFFGKYKDYDNFFLNRNDVKNLIPVIKYYLFLGKHPITEKYNPLQKLAYLAMPIMAVIQLVTGAILYWPTKFPTLGAAFGGLAAVRGIHYLIMWLFLSIILIHIYLVLIEAYDQFLLMFFGKCKDEVDSNKANTLKKTAWKEL
ncbi:MAG: Ni/Fe-hydrogenase, b-type cytochrome subunit [Desulfitobacterium hafniense]|nr:Ni/Fe-hydrogenase, b-type cytochrome subunit [Desulfitobacterium hafniense]